MAAIEMEYEDVNGGKCLRVWKIPDDIFIRKIKIRAGDGTLLWVAEFDYDWLKEFLTRQSGGSQSEIQANSSSI